MADNTAIVDSLRKARQVDDVLTRLKAGSLEARASRISEALASAQFAAGPAELIATFPHHVVASKDGILMRVRVQEDDNTIKLGKVEVFQVPTPVRDLGAEVMETAIAAVGHILDENFDAATPLVAAIANALNTEGDLKRKITTEVAKRSVNRSATWHQIVAEQMAGEEIDVPQSFDDLLSMLREAALAVSDAARRLDGQNPTAEVTEVASGVAADLKYAIQAMTTVDRDNEDELASVHEGVSAVAGHLLLGAGFLKRLAGPNEED